MRIGRWIGVWAICLLMAGCAGMDGGANHQAKTALAPTGKLRVAFLLAPIYATKNATTGELNGVAVDLGKELARRLEVPFEPVTYTGAPALIGDAKTGKWDIVLTGISPERAVEIDFSPPYMEAEQGCLVRSGAAIASVTDLDQPGIRIGMLEKSFADAPLSRSTKSATIVRTKTLGELYALLESGNADAIVSGKTGLFAAAAKISGARVLDGRILSEPIGIGVPKGRIPAASEHVSRFVAEVRSNGSVGALIDKAGLRGVVVAR